LSKTGSPAVPAHGSRTGAKLNMARAAPCESRVEDWWSGPGLNRQPPACKADALPIELPPRYLPVHSRTRHRLLLVGLGRVELPTSPLSGARSSQLSYRPFLKPGRRPASNAGSNLQCLDPILSKNEPPRRGSVSQDQIVVRAGVQRDRRPSPLPSRFLQEIATRVDHEWLHSPQGRNVTR
jgi:hypothetical protein